jgi:iron(III) transport system substrate-binding protein
MVLSLNAEMVQAQSGRVVIYATGGTKVGKALNKAFQEKYPDIKVDPIFGGTGELITRLRAEGKNPLCDVFRGGAEAIDAMPELFESYKTKEHDMFLKSAVGEGARWYGQTVTIQLFIVNTNKMPLDQAPKSWKDLGDPKYKGKILAAHPSLSGSSYRQLAQMLQLYGWDFVKKVIDNTEYVTKSRMVYTNVSKGQMHMGLTEESKPYRMAQKGYPVVAVYPSEGVAMAFGAVAIVKNAPNPKNARLLADFYNSKEGHALVLKKEPRRSARKDMKAPEYMPSTESVKFFVFDQATAAKNREANLRKFEKIYAEAGKKKLKKKKK